MGVTFDSAYQAGDKLYYGKFHSDPLYGQQQSDPHDIAVVVFDKSINGITLATLPTAGSLSDISSTQTFTSVGDGAYEVTTSRAVVSTSTTTSGWLRPGRSTSSTAPGCGSR